MTKPPHIVKLNNKFLENAKACLKEPFHYLEELANDGYKPRPEFTNLLEVIVEFFHFMGFFLQPGK